MMEMVGLVRYYIKSQVVIFLKFFSSIDTLPQLLLFKSELNIAGVSGHFTNFFCAIFGPKLF